MDVRDERTANRAFQARLAVSASFLCNGLILSSWVSRIPTITDDLSLNNAEVGAAFMGIALGSMSIFPFAGKLVGSRGSANVVLGSGLLLAAAIPFVAVAPNVYFLFAALFIGGIGNGGTEVSMNSQGAEVERLSRKNIMSSLHGSYSLGAFAGAGIGAGAAALSVDPLIHIGTMCAICAVIYSVGRRWMIPDSPTAHGTSEAPIFALPPRSLWLLGAVGICVAIGEGAIGDWSGLYLNDDLGTSAAFAALGFASCQFAMLVGRFTGDRLVARFGAVPVLRFGSLLAAIGLGLGVLVHLPYPALVSFLAAGLGLAVGFPLVMSAAANRRDLPRGQSVAAISTLAYSGFLAGPPVLGWVAEATSLRFMFGIVTALCLTGVIFAGAAKGAGEIVDDSGD